MDIKLHARLSAYSKVDANLDPGCDHEVVTFDDIDSLFDDKNSSTTIPEVENTTNTVSFAEIDSLFR